MFVYARNSATRNAGIKSYSSNIMNTFGKILLVLICVVSVNQSQAQSQGTGGNMWKTLAKITFKKEFDELLGFKVDKPVFSEEIAALNGKEVTITGYIIPVEGYKNHKEFILSAYPYNMCFFCGGAGPETVMEIVAKEAIPYSAEAITIKGKLEINADDINRLMYAMSGVVKVK